MSPHFQLILCGGIEHGWFFASLSNTSGSVSIFAMNESRDSLVQINHFSLRHVKEYAQGERISILRFLLSILETNITF